MGFRTFGVCLGLDFSVLSFEYRYDERWTGRRRRQCAPGASDVDDDERCDADDARCGGRASEPFGVRDRCARDAARDDDGGATEG